MDLKAELTRIAQKARAASARLAALSAAVKNELLIEMAGALHEKQDAILAANEKDTAEAKASGLAAAMIDRLTLDERRLEEMRRSFFDIAGLHDPVGEVIHAWRVPNGLWIHKVRVPIGVIAIIYESRPNVTADCAGLCLKSGNSVILRGGSESIHSNAAIFGALNNVILRHGLPDGVISLVTTTDRAAVNVLLTLDEYIDLVIPRGGKSLISHVAGHSRIPVIKHYHGICHVYVDEWADLNMARKICFNAKVQRPATCNAMECMLVHKDVSARFLPPMLKEFDIAGVEIRGCPLTRKLFKKAKPVTDNDYRTEYLDLILSVRVVDDIQQAMEHINTFGSHHSDTIVTENYENSMRFLRQVDSACVYVNASTRFTDGAQFGMGAEIGISTDKLHARGPMALEELTTYKYMVFGSGQIRT